MCALWVGIGSDCPEAAQSLQDKNIHLKKFAPEPVGLDGFPCSCCLRCWWRLRKHPRLRLTDRLVQFLRQQVAWREHGEVLRHPNAGLVQLHQFDSLLRLCRAEDQAEG